MSQCRRCGSECVARCTLLGRTARTIATLTRCGDCGEASETAGLPRSEFNQVWPEVFGPKLARARKMRQATARRDRARHRRNWAEKKANTVYSAKMWADRERVPASHKAFPKRGNTYTGR